MVSNKVALIRYRTKINFSNICTSGVVYLVNLLCSKDCTFASLRIVKRTVTPYNVLWDAGAFYLFFINLYN